jgi:hypothetical protein
LAGDGRGQAGKLKWAGRAWATGQLTNAPSEIELDARRWGLDPALFQEAEPEALWQAHLPALNAFLAVAGQWRMVPRPGGGWIYLGLDYTAAQAGFALADITVSPDLWADVQMIEAGAVAALNGKM